MHEDPADLLPLPASHLYVDIIWPFQPYACATIPTKPTGIATCPHDGECEKVLHKYEARGGERRERDAQE